MGQSCNTRHHVTWVVLFLVGESKQFLWFHTTSVKSLRNFTIPDKIHATNINGCVSLGQWHPTGGSLAVSKLQLPACHDSWQMLNSMLWMETLQQQGSQGLETECSLKGAVWDWLVGVPWVSINFVYPGTEPYIRVLAWMTCSTRHSHTTLCGAVPKWTVVGLQYSSNHHSPLHSANYWGPVGQKTPWSYFDGLW